MKESKSDSIVAVILIVLIGMIIAPCMAITKEDDEETTYVKIVAFVIGVLLVFLGGYGMGYIHGGNLIKNEAVQRSYGSWVTNSEFKWKGDDEAK